MPKTISYYEQIQNLNKQKFTLNNSRLEWEDFLDKKKDSNYTKEECEKKIKGIDEQIKTLEITIKTLEKSRKGDGMAY
jgi:predicted  nucleic acid-binding Zn-ribbon protein